jgi:hypothetical protein
MIPAIMYNPVTKEILCGGSIPQGSMIRFSLPPDFDVIDTVVDSARQVKNTTLPDIDAMIIFSCIGRLSANSVRSLKRRSMDSKRFGICP